MASVFSIAQSRLREFVDSCFESGSLWPDPLIQLNPTFKPGKTVAEPVREGVLASGCTQVFRREKTAPAGSGDDLLFHQHQEDAIRKAKEGRNFVLTRRIVQSEIAHFAGDRILVALPRQLTSRCRLYPQCGDN